MDYGHSPLRLNFTSRFGPGMVTYEFCPRPTRVCKARPADEKEEGKEDKEEGEEDQDYQVLVPH